MKKPTLGDVAELAGTSIAVVSYVANDGPRPVAPQTRDRVLAAMKELGWVPNRHAQVLRGGRSGIIGLLVPDVANPFFGMLTRAVETVAARDGRLVLVANTDFLPEREAEFTARLAGLRPDGLLIISAGRHVDTPPVPTPAVYVHHRPDSATGQPLVRADNHRAGRLATRHLLDHGHSEVAYVGGPSDQGGPLDERRRGWAHAHHDAGLDPPDDLLWQVGRDLDDTHDRLVALLGNPGRPTAIVGSTDAQAMLVSQVAASLGLRVPDDLAIAGCDGIPQTRRQFPPLTTAALDVPAMARSAIELLDRPPADRSDVVIGVRLEVGGSCGCG